MRRKFRVSVRPIELSCFREYFVMLESSFAKSDVREHCQHTSARNPTTSPPGADRIVYLLACSKPTRILAHSYSRVTINAGGDSTRSRPVDF